MGLTRIQFDKNSGQCYPWPADSTTSPKVTRRQNRMRACVRYALVLFAPYGLETRWPLAFDGRFAGYKNILQSLYIQPTLAYQVSPRLSLGAGLDVVLGKVELNQRLDLADQLVPLPGVPAGTRFSLF